MRTPSPPTTWCSHRHWRTCRRRSAGSARSSPSSSSWSGCATTSRSPHSTTSAAVRRSRCRPGSASRTFRSARTYLARSAPRPPCWNSPTHSKKLAGQLLNVGKVRVTVSICSFGPYLIMRCTLKFLSKLLSVPGDSGITEGTPCVSRVAGFLRPFYWPAVCSRFMQSQPLPQLGLARRQHPRPQPDHRVVRR